MYNASRKISYACILLLILLTAIVGQKVHIYREDPLHFVSFCQSPGSDNGADCGFSEKCVVDDFYFFPCLCVETFLIETRFELLGRPGDVPTCTKHHNKPRLTALRAPPASR